MAERVVVTDACGADIYGQKKGGSVVFCGVEVDFGGDCYRAVLFIVA